MKKNLKHLVSSIFVILIFSVLQMHSPQAMESKKTSQPTTPYVYTTKPNEEPKQLGNIEYSNIESLVKPDSFISETPNTTYHGNLSPRERKHAYC